MKSGFKNSISNGCYFTNEKLYGSETPQTLLNLFELNKINSDSVEISFNQQNHLVLSFKINDKIKTETFKGKFIRNGIYEIFIRKVKQEIPPVFPFIYSKRDIFRIRVGLNNDKGLVVDIKSARDGNIFLFAAGSNKRYQNFYRIYDKSVP